MNTGPALSSHAPQGLLTGTAQTGDMSWEWVDDVPPISEDISSTQVTDATTTRSVLDLPTYTSTHLSSPLASTVKAASEPVESFSLSYSADFYSCLPKPSELFTVGFSFEKFKKIWIRTKKVTKSAKGSHKTDV